DGAEATRPGLSVVVNPSIGLCLVLADSASLQVAMSAVEKALDRQFGGAAKIKLVEARLGKSCGGFEVDSSSGPISITFGQGSATYACGMEGGQVMTMRRGPA
ncbi:MAG: hypothetical protein VX463_02030, partial [Pseudomonadota bacterium]|nr:hypothetical protein [Pseudomonadota bacterium]